MPIVTLLSDFGTSDSYVAQMKGVIMTICPGCQIMDIAHEVSRHDVLTGAFLLETSAPHFPEGTIHLAVVDPGVGSMRLPIVVRCKRAVLVGPDNGLLTRAARRLAFISAFSIRPSFKERPVSHTFHGRDIFATAAARLACGARPDELGPRVGKLVELEISVAKVGRGSLGCYVLHVDRFGNIITNAESEKLGKAFLNPGEPVTVSCKTGVFHAVVAHAYHEVNRGEFVVIPGSQGYVEVALREGDAAARLGTDLRDELAITAVS